MLLLLQPLTASPYIFFVRFVRTQRNITYVLIHAKPDDIIFRGGDGRTLKSVKKDERKQHLLVGRADLAILSPFELSELLRHRLHKPLFLLREKCGAARKNSSSRKASNLLVNTCLFHKTSAHTLNLVGSSKCNVTVNSSPRCVKQIGWS